MYGDKIEQKKTYVICYDKFHNLTRKGFVFNGKLDSKWEIYSDGKLFKIGSYKNDKRVGTWKEYYVSGTEVFIGKYKNDFQTGKWKVYESEIDLRVSKSNSKMKLTEIRKYKEGKLIEKKLIDINGKCIKIEKCQK